jgi:hypothetical protein
MLAEIQFVKHLIIDFRQEITGQVDCTDTRHGTKRASSDIVNVVITEVEPTKETHTAKRIRIQFSDLVAAQIHYSQHLRLNKNPSVIKII